MDKRSIIETPEQELNAEDLLTGSIEDLEAEVKFHNERMRRFILLCDATSSMQPYWTEAINAIKWYLAP